MDNAMVTGRMSSRKKAEGGRILEKAGLNASQAINLLYDRLLEEQNADFLLHRAAEPREWDSAAKFLNSLAAPKKISTRFDTMTRGEIKLDRLKSRGVI